MINASLVSPDPKRLTRPAVPELQRAASSVVDSKAAR